jgi:cell division protease FtsH
VVDQETRRIIDECYVSARKLVEMERDRLASLAEALLEHESLEADEVKALLEKAGARRV